MIVILGTTNNIEEFMKSDTFKVFDDEVREYTNKVEKEHLESLKNDVQKKIFTDWCNGICVCSDEYKQNNSISKEDDYEAHTAILSVISLGLG